MTRFEFGVSGSADRAAWDAAGGGAADVVAALLRSLGYGNVFTAPPAVSLCAEPIVLAAGEFVRDARQVDGTERGTLPVGGTVCCDDPRARRLDGREHRVARARRRGGHYGAAPARARRFRALALGPCRRPDDCEGFR